MEIKVSRENEYRAFWRASKGVRDAIKERDLVTAFEWIHELEVIALYRTFIRLRAVRSNIESFAKMDDPEVACFARLALGRMEAE